VILVLTNADTELLALRVAAEGLPPGFPSVRAANPNRLLRPPSVAGVSLVLVRLLGGRLAWPDGLDALVVACRSAGVPLVALGGETVPDAELAALSSVPQGIVTEAFTYLSHGGVANMGQLLRFLADTVLLGGWGFDPPTPVATTSVYRDDRGDDLAVPAHDGPTASSGRRPTVGVVFYRAHLLAGNVGFVDDLCDAIGRAGGAAVAVSTYSLRPDADGRVPAVELLADVGVDVVVTTTLAAGSLDETADSWDAGAVGRLGVAVVQAICATSSAAEWAESTTGLSPTDVAMAVAVPEFDGRIVTVPISTKEVVDDDELLGTPLTAYRTLHDRVQRVAELAVRLGRLRHIPPGQRRVALVLSAYPTKRSRLGNAVGLDTPASVVALLERLRDAGYRVDRIPADGDSLMAELADGLSYDAERPTPAQVAGALGTLPGDEYRRWFDEADATVVAAVEKHWGAAPGQVGVATVEGTEQLVFAGIDLGHVVVAVQPPRGFGADPVAVYHSPDLPPTHHYLGFYRWLDTVWKADAIVHVGKHGTLEWLPGKSVGLSGGCGPDAALGSVPLIYPFVVNDPGEGTQAKRRAHAVIVDHLVPPLTRAEVYDDLARLEQLLDEHARVATLDPTKLPAVRRLVWECLVDAEIHRDLGWAGRTAEATTDPAGRSAGDGAAPVPGFDDPAFDDLLPEVDGYLCELKDAQIRGGLHVLGRAPTGDEEIDLLLAMTRLPQGRVPSLRRVVAAALGLDVSSGPTARRRDVDRLDAVCRELLRGCRAAGWQVPHDLAGLLAGAGTGGGAEPAETAPNAWESVRGVLEWVCGRLVPDLRATSGELDAVLAALDGRFVLPGPSGAPSRGHAHVLPTGRNFYGVDPRAIPSPLAWEVGSRLAEALVARHQAEEGGPPRHVALVVWGTAAMRTGGDDVAEALALLGVRPRWSPESGRVEGLDVVPLAELGRPRVDVTLRVSGFFRDAFPHVVGLVDEAAALVAALEEPAEDNPLVGRGDEPRIFGPPPGAYGSGILTLLESRQWRSDEDLAAVYVAWGGWSYGRSGMGVPAADELRLRLAQVEVAVKNQDNREHDIFDSDDYLQDHGGMVATIRALTGRQPKAWFGDSADPARPRVRSLAEEAARVVRSRVVNPKWVAAMMRHGYKGAFEMAATVDYLFGYDATANVVEDWMYERVTAAYVADPRVRQFFQASNPWALRSIAERLLEAADRGLWRASADALATLRDATLEAEGWEEDR
jgi:cobaltochelatase CobN